MRGVGSSRLCRRGRGHLPSRYHGGGRGAGTRTVLLGTCSRQTRHHATQSAAGNGRGSRTWAVVAVSFWGSHGPGGVPARGREQPAEDPGWQQLGHQLPSGICLLKGTTILRMHLRGQTLQPDPRRCSLMGVQVSRAP